MQVRQNIPFIHVLRGIAPIIVFWAHAPGWWLLEKGLIWQPFEWFKALFVLPLHLYQNAGHLGVIIFYLISGYIISAVAISENRRDFLVKRLARLLPTLIVCTGLMFVLTAVSNYWEFGPIYGNQASSPSDYLMTAFLLNWIFMSPNAMSVTWSLVAELIFYAMVLLLMGTMRRKPLRATYLMIGGFLLLSLPSKVVSYLEYMSYFTVYIPVMIQGRAFFLLHSKTIGGQEFSALSFNNALLFIVIYTFRFPGQLMTANVEPLITYALAAAVFYAMMLAKSFRCPPIIGFFADISYALYLVHLPVGMFLLSAMHKFSMPLFASVFVAWTVSIGLSWVVHVWVEKPCQRLVRKWTKSSARPLSPAAQVPSPI